MPVRAGWRDRVIRREEDSLSRKRSVLVALGMLVAVLALVAAGCGGDDGGKTLKIASDLPLQGSDRVQT